jgi:hypothetical protein
MSRIKLHAPERGKPEPFGPSSTQSQVITCTGRLTSSACQEQDTGDKGSNSKHDQPKDPKVDKVGRRSVEGEQRVSKVAELALPY